MACQLVLLFVINFVFLPQLAFPERPALHSWPEDVTQALARYEERARIILEKYRQAPDVVRFLRIALYMYKQRECMRGRVTWTITHVAHPCLSIHYIRSHFLLLLQKLGTPAPALWFVMARLEWASRRARSCWMAQSATCT